jgi:hypothetical protein
MSDEQNGKAPGHHEPARRLRVDDFAAIVRRNTPGMEGTTSRLERGHSGRSFVIAAGVTVLLVWGILYLFFREWRSGYRERAIYGKTQVLPTIEPLRAIQPPKVDPVAWRDAVDQTRAMLVTVIDSNLLDLKDMDSLRVELARHVGRASVQPATAVRELAEIWNEAADRGEFLFRDSRSASGERHARPTILPPRPLKSAQPTRSRPVP